ncbi:hypothetical protein [Tranquillimonas rosea]|uniref:hypothetical protein n=1 Tax=Tranquillimonas rosea TaxID=641238 RepID=UPI003BA84DDA
MRILAVVIAMLGAPAVAQDLPSVDAALADFDGTEVSASGRIYIIRQPGTASLQVGEQSYLSSFALDRETLEAVAECTGDNPTCTADVSAEIRMVEDRVHLLIFDVRNLRQE